MFFLVDDASVPVNPDGGKPAMNFYFEVLVTSSPGWGIDGGFQVRTDLEEFEDKEFEAWIRVGHTSYSFCVGWLTNGIVGIDRPRFKYTRWNP